MINNQNNKAMKTKERPSQEFLNNTFVQPCDMDMPLKPTGRVKFHSDWEDPDGTWLIEAKSVVTEKNKNWHHCTRWFRIWDLKSVN